MAAWLVSNLAYLAGLVLLWRWARLRWESERATRVVILFAVFPFSIFFLTPYAEALFFALAVSAFVLAEQNRWWQAAIIVGLATITRPLGPALLVALLIMALQHGNRRAAGYILLSAAPALAFVAYLGFTVGHPLGIVVYHSAGWVTPHGGLLSTLTSQFHTNLTPFDRVDAFVSILFLISAALVWRTLGAPYGAFVLLGVLLPLAHGLVSMERYVIVLFPAIGLWATWDGKVRQAFFFGISLMGLVLVSIMFASGYSIF
jgi:hypothetical protein